MIDLARAPIYLHRAADLLANISILGALAVLAGLGGTLASEVVLLVLRRDRFRQIVSIAIGMLGAWFLFCPA